MKRSFQALIASFAIIAFLAAYIWVAVWIGVRLPENVWVRLAYYSLAGTLWGVPLLPLMSWLAKGSSRRGDGRSDRI